MKLAFYEYFTAAGLDNEAFTYFHYLADRIEANKFVQWNRGVTGQIVAQYDSGFAVV